MSEERPGRFDRFAGWAAGVTGRAPYFVFCVLLVVAWALQGLVISQVRGWGYFLDPKYQLIINSPTTILTFWIAALIQNTQSRNDKAVQVKLDAIAQGVADVLDALPEGVGDENAHRLREATGLEGRVRA